MAIGIGPRWDLKDKEQAIVMGGGERKRGWRTFQAEGIRSKRP